MTAEPALKLVETEEVETKALTIVDQAKAVVVKDAATYTAAGALWKDIRDMMKEVAETFDPIIEAAHRSHKKALEQKAKFYKPLEDAQKSIKSLMSAYDAEQERIRREEEARLAEIRRKEEEARRAEELRILEEERKAEEERLLQAAAEAEKNGDKAQAEDLLQTAEERAQEAAQTAAEIQAAPVYVPPVVVPRATPKLAGGPVYQVKWACEVTDIRKLCMAVVNGASTEYVMGLEKDKATGKISSPALNKMAVALKDTMSVPGCKAWSRRV
jgi:hypothetical protein